MQNYLLNIFLYSCTALLLCAPVYALASNYAVMPLVIDHELEKRDIITETITLTNNDSRVIRLYPTVNEIAISEGGTVQTFVPPVDADRSTSITSWLEIGRGRIELQPGESKEVLLTIRVNPNVAAGEYHAFVGFPEGSNRPDAQKKVYQGNVPGTVVSIGVDKVQSQFLRLSRFTVDRFIKDTDESVVQYQLENPGDDPVIPEGEIIFYDTAGIEVAAVAVNPEGNVVNGGESVLFDQALPDDLKMGKYKAFLSVEFGEHQKASVHDTAFFYVFPLTALAILFAVVLILSLGIALLVQRRFDAGVTDIDADDVALYVREGRSESKDHDIDLSKKS